MEVFKTLPAYNRTEYHIIKALPYVIRDFGQRINQ